MERMNKQDLVNRIAEKASISKKKAEIAVDGLLNGMKSAFLRGERIEIRGFGVFTVHYRKYGQCRNVVTGEVVPIQPRFIVNFKAGRGITGKTKLKES